MLGGEHGGPLLFVRVLAILQKLLGLVQRPHLLLGGKEVERELLVLVNECAILGSLRDVGGVLLPRLDRVLLGLGRSEVGALRGEVSPVAVKLAAVGVEALVSLAASWVVMLAADHLLEVLD